MDVIKSNEELLAIANQDVKLNAEYTFYTPGSINAPAGTFHLTMLGKRGIGTIQFHTLWELGSRSKAGFGITHVDGHVLSGEAIGTTKILGQIPKAWAAKITIDFKVEWTSGTISLEGFFKNLPFHIIHKEEN